MCSKNDICKPAETPQQHLSPRLAPTDRVKSAGVEKNEAYDLRKTKATGSGSPDLILVKANNRLGLKAEISCSITDTIGYFKKLVAYQAGIKPKDMLLKRQGQPSFRDFLTLEDCEIGNGSSVDLEVNTSD